MDGHLELIEALWDSIDAKTDALLLPDWHRVQSDDRLDALDAGASVGPPWEEVRRRIVGKRRNVRHAEAVGRYRNRTIEYGRKCEEGLRRFANTGRNSPTGAVVGRKRQ